MMDRWKKSVVHLEMAADSLSFQNVMELQNQVKEQRITEEKFVHIFQNFTRNIRQTGTAFLVEDDSGVFLVSARHVLYSGDVARHDETLFQDPAMSASLLGADEMSRFKAQTLEQSIFRMIFRVPTLDETKKWEPPFSDTNFLMNLGVGPITSRSYTLSNATIDVGVICLTHPQHTCSAFWQKLRADGFEPISIKDFCDGPVHEGQEIFTVGFPTNISHVSGRPEINRAWGSNIVSLPAFSFGKVSMTHPELPFFWADMTVYGGNSGGPVIAGNKLAGLVSGQAIVADENATTRVRAPFAAIVHAEHIRSIIVEQKIKNRVFELPASQPC